MSTTDDATGSSTISPTDTIRLSVNISGAVADILRRRASVNDISITEAVDRAITVWEFFEREQADGNVVAFVEREGAVDRVREVVMRR